MLLIYDMYRGYRYSGCDDGRELADAVEAALVKNEFKDDPLAFLTHYQSKKLFLDMTQMHE